MAENPDNTKQTKRRSKPHPDGEQPKPKIQTIIENFRSLRTRLGIGIFLAIVTVVMTIVLISFLKNGALDQSLVTAKSISEIAASAEGVENAGGPAGAKLAHLLMVDGLGIGSFVLIFYLGGLALALFGAIRIKFWSFTFKCLFTAVALSIIVGLFTYNAETVFHWGGNHGRYVNQWLYSVTDVIGAYAVTIFLIGMLAVMYLNQIKRAYVNASGTIAKTRLAMAEAAKKGREPGVVLAEMPVADEGNAVNSAEPTAEPALSRGVQSFEPKLRGFSIDDALADDVRDEVGSITSDEIPPAQGPEAAETDGALQIDEVEPETEKGGKEPVFSILTPEQQQQVKTVGFDEITQNSDLQPYDIRDELSRYRFPSPSLLIDRPVTDTINQSEQEDNKNQIITALKSFDIEIASIEATIGPTVTRYEIVPAEGVRIAQIKRLEDDIALSLAALGIRIIAPIPGKGTIGIEVPNRNPQVVSMRSVINSKKFRECNMALPMALGVTINNNIFIADLAKMPHLLVAGGTGQGKSVGLNCIIASLLYKKHPGELKFVLIDPKQLEFSLYSKLENHFLAKLPDEEEAIVIEPDKALQTLSSVCVEMERRYSLLRTASVRNIEDYNHKFSERRLNPEKGHSFMPYLVVIVDEFADLVATAGKDILLYIGRIAAKARAAGIHMIIATQRPSTDVITGVIKSNFLGRIAFRVMQSVDSKTILDRPGANRLIGRGDMLFSHSSSMERVQCAFIDTPEVEALVDFINAQIGYPSAYILPEPEKEGSGVVPGAIDLSKRDELFDDCARFVVQNTTASTSSLQRRFGIGYNKAGKIMDQLEAAGVVGPADGQKPRSVLIDSIQLESILRGL